VQSFPRYPSDRVGWVCEAESHAVTLAVTFNVIGKTGGDDGGSGYAVIVFHRT